MYREEARGEKLPLVYSVLSKYLFLLKTINGLDKPSEKASLGTA